MSLNNLRRSILALIATIVVPLGTITGSAAALSPTDIVGMGIASNNKIYTWYDNGTRSVGWSRNLDYYEAPQSYSMPPGYNPSDIVAMAIASNDRIYTWYSNGRRSIGWSRDLDYYESPQTYTLPPPNSHGFPNISDIAGMGIRTNDRVHTWYGANDTLLQGRRSVGWSRDLDHYHWPKNYWLPGAGLYSDDIVGMGIANNNKVYTWFRNGTCIVGKPGDLDYYQSPQSFSMP